MAALPFSLRGTLVLCFWQRLKATHWPLSRIEGWKGRPQAKMLQMNAWISLTAQTPWKPLPAQPPCEGRLTLLKGKHDITELGMTKAQCCTAATPPAATAEHSQWDVTSLAERLWGWDGRSGLVSNAQDVSHHNSGTNPCSTALMEAGQRHCLQKWQCLVSIGSCCSSITRSSCGGEEESKSILPHSSENRKGSESSVDRPVTFKGAITFKSKTPFQWGSLNGVLCKISEGEVGCPGDWLSGRKWEQKSVKTEKCKRQPIKQHALPDSCTEYVLGYSCSTLLSRWEARKGTTVKNVWFWLYYLHGNNLKVSLPFGTDWEGWLMFQNNLVGSTNRESM